jgi:hypothetical protein
MKVRRKSFIITAAAAALTVGVLMPAAPASAAPTWPAELGPEPAEWGVVDIEIDPSSTQVTPKTTKDKGGGTWTYGTEVVADGKRCYSYYFHGSKGHSATVKIASVGDYDHAAAGTSAKASRTAGAVYTCHAYWSKDD